MRWTTRTTTGLTNIHEREVRACPAEVWEAMSTLSSPQDRVWPRDRWPRLRLSDGLRPGSDGGHGPIRYGVTRVEEGSALTFALDPAGGMSGWHGFTLAPTDAGTRVTHTLAIESPSATVITVVVPLHDALLEDLLDQLAAAVEHRELTRSPHSLGVRARRALVRVSARR